MLIKNFSRAKNNLWLIFPLALTCLRLRQMGVFDLPFVGAPGSDFYGTAGIARLLLKYPFRFPVLIEDFLYPSGTPTASLPEFFSEPLSQLWLQVLLIFQPEPVRAVWLGMVSTMLFNIWGTWALLWRRFGATSPAAVVGAWALICLSPWPWARNTFHWMLGWTPIILFCFLLWWDLFVHERALPKWRGILAHALLLGQSIYYGVFLIMAVALWSLCSLGRLRSAEWRKKLIQATLLAVAGYALMVGLAASRMGGVNQAGTAISETKRPKAQLHVYSVRMREMTKGGPGSIFNDWIKAKHASRDEENFPAPLPKLWLIACAILAWRGRAKRTSLVALAGIGGFLIFGLQEIPWIRESVLYFLFPFIRSYARIMMPILCIATLWTAEVLSLVRRRAHQWGAVTFAFALFYIDYGWPQSPFGVASHVSCEDRVARIKLLGKPLFIHQTEPLNDLACEGLTEFPFLALTGLPLVTRPWVKPTTSMKLGSLECSEWGPRVRAAVAKAKGVTWWYEGTMAEWEEARTCVGSFDLQITEKTLTRESGRLLLISTLSETTH